MDQQNTLIRLVITIFVASLVGAVVALGFMVGKDMYLPSVQQVSTPSTSDYSETNPSTSVTALKEGLYALEGYNSSSDIPSYTGLVRITKDGDVYKLEWTIQSQSQRGVGILEGNILSVGYLDITGGSLNDTGVVSYKLLSDTKLDGLWSSVSGNNPGREVLTWTSL
jgi:hypothetical protein